MIRKIRNLVIECIVFPLESSKVTSSVLVKEIYIFMLFYLWNITTSLIKCTYIYHSSCHTFTLWTHKPSLFLQEAIKCMLHSKRTILTTDDVNSALQLRNVEVLLSHMWSICVWNWPLWYISACFQIHTYDLMFVLLYIELGSAILIYAAQVHCLTSFVLNLYMKLVFMILSLLV